MIIHHLNILEVFNRYLNIKKDEIVTKEVIES